MSLIEPSVIAHQSAKSLDIETKTKMVMEVFGDLLNTIVETANTSLPVAPINAASEMKVILSRSGPRSAATGKLAADHRSYISKISELKNQTVTDTLHEIVEYYAMSKGYDVLTDTKMPVTTTVASAPAIAAPVAIVPAEQEMTDNEKKIVEIYGHRKNLPKILMIYRMSIKGCPVSSIVETTGVDQRRVVQFRSELAQQGLIPLTRCANHKHPRSAKVEHVAEVAPVVPVKEEREVAEIVPASKVSPSVFAKPAVDPKADMTVKFAASRTKGRPKKYQLEEMVVNSAMRFPMTDFREVMARSNEVENAYPGVKFFMEIKDVTTGSIQRLR